MSTDDYDDFINEINSIKTVDQIISEEEKIKSSSKKKLTGNGEFHVNRILLMANKENPYDILMLDFEATEEDIQKQYKSLSVLIHPDKCRGHPGAHEAFQILNESIKNIKNSQVKDKYSAVYDRAKLMVEKEIDNSTENTIITDAEKNSKIFKKCEEILQSEIAEKTKKEATLKANEDRILKLYEESIEKRKMEKLKQAEWKAQFSSRTQGWKDFRRNVQDGHVKLDITKNARGVHGK